MALSTKDFNSLTQEIVANVQGFAKVLVDLTIGSILRAVVEATASVVMWLQGLILALLAITRAATSSGADLDSWVNDFGVTRLAAVTATGNVTFSRFTPSQQAVVPVGAVVQTADGSQQYTVNLDTSNPAYNQTLGGYVIAAGTASVIVTATASVAGSAANVIAGAISSLAQAIPYVDTVANASALTNGEDAETDSALRLRFIAYIASLAKATKAAIGYAITSLQQGLTYTITENYTYAGVYQPGYFWVAIDDGSGNPSDSLVSTVYNAIDAVRPFTVTFDVKKPIIATAAVVMTITTASGYVHSAVASTVQSALQNYINSLPLGTSLAYSRLAQVAYDASTGVVNVTGVTLNGGTSDVTADSKTVVKSSTIVVN
ncbi:baseplate J/gp47 family protein [Burkholderia ambifaria]|uniref:baseplate J/gp47 family protein n=1 Tax=Burkholderia ambifaria TaxID=152480 RepID=UPI001B926241|nr:baseplate J/gp47 family protein [Burkholderia ambifaria]MBR8182084.1 baseplate J/gp47 family protein [Burkholderia ambifaria]